MNIIKTDLLMEVDFIDHGFFGKLDGFSKGLYESLNVAFHTDDEENDVLQNRKKVAESFDIDISNFITLNQQHGDIVHFIDSKNLKDYQFKNPKQSLEIKGDAIITDQKGVLIGVQTADCAPILISDKSKKIIAVIHAGWRGATGNIIENTIQKLKELGCLNLVASIGPCLQKRYFEIGKEVISIVDKKYTSSLGEKILFDMPFLILEKLMKLGCKTVSKLNIDTLSNGNSFFSYRRHGQKSGRQFSGIIIKK